jgi:hypothetical protein
MPNGWPSAIAPPKGLRIVVVDAQVLRRGQHLRREGLVDLHDVHVVDGHPRPGQGLLGRRDRAEPHDLRIQGGHAGGDDPGQRLDAELRGLDVRHDDQRRRPVVERAGVAGGDPTVGPEHRRELAILSRFAGRGDSSASITLPSGRVIGVISRSQNPAALASA